jgi:hypothetical protein
VGEEVVGRAVGGLVVGHRANGDDVGHVTRDLDRHRVGAKVATGGDDDDAGLAGRHYSLVQRAVPVLQLPVIEPRQVF